MDGAMRKAGHRWVGPFRLRDYLDRCIDPAQERPPEAAGVYVVSRRAWVGQPSEECGVLYVGSNPKAPTQFRNRVGLLLKDMLGFWAVNAQCTHSGGQSIHRWCCTNKVNPLDLYLGWVIGIECGRCTESELYGRHQPCLNRKTPARCKAHTPSLATAMGEPRT